MLSESLEAIGDRLLFARTDARPTESIYSEQGLQGYFSIVANEESEENTPDVELLYKAMMQEPGKIKDLFK